jgi:hypothetical protein
MGIIAPLIATTQGPENNNLGPLKVVSKTASSLKFPTNLFAVVKEYLSIGPETGNPNLLYP